MSDEFDKEAEREKLREKFAEDEEKREHTQRMSELLLQGATMTNRHCETCGDPIFRHDGREFCPTCHATEDGYEVPAEGTVPAGGDDESDGTAGAIAGEAETSGARSPETAAANGVVADDDTGSTAASDEVGPDPAGDLARGSIGDAAGTSRSAEGMTGSADPEPPAPGTEVDASGVGPARESLTRTLTRFARAAEETEDPRRAREHLRAAREAAEALSALD
ncbi:MULTISPECIES: Sjogren's syndrome/scleroderma autoantigen 1 family protein [Haloferacaceae]|uniref:Sjogren's syndrome/scleroderma autoantigen 1 family protein n=1 Tax=Halorubrum glutamatedens TaxID=2707018 RepID=A0ABD5QNT4_9EURY|nr:Sjogren's syndrome/scleroderma autoantigen 1 family protein [Halobellus captivus]